MKLLTAMVMSLSLLASAYAHANQAGAPQARTLLGRFK